MKTFFITLLILAFINFIASDATCNPKYELGHDPLAFMVYSHCININHPYVCRRQRGRCRCYCGPKK